MTDRELPEDMLLIPREDIARIEVAHLSGLTIEAVYKMKWGETDAYIKLPYWKRGLALADQILTKIRSQIEQRSPLSAEGVALLITKYRSDCANEGLSQSEDTEFEIVAQAQKQDILNLFSEEPK